MDENHLAYSAVHKYKDRQQTDRQTDTVQAAAATCSTPDPAQLMTWGSSSCSPSRCSCKNQLWLQVAQLLKTAA